MIIRRVTQNECYVIMLRNACLNNIKKTGLTFSIFDGKSASDVESVMNGLLIRFVGKTYYHLVTGKTHA